MKDSLAPEERESSVTAAIHANIAQFLFPFVFTIIFSNFVVSILVDTYLRKRRISATDGARAGASRASTFQVCSGPCSSRRRPPTISCGQQHDHH